MERVRAVILDYYQNRRREFYMIVFLIFLVFYNLYSYLMGSPYNMFAMVFGKRGGKNIQTAQQGQEANPAALSSVKESQQLQEAANNVSQNPPVEQTAPPQQAAPETQALPETAAEKKDESFTPVQTTQPSSLTFLTPVKTVARGAYQELDKVVYYRDDPFMPIVRPVVQTTTHIPKWPPRTVRKVCGTIVAGGSTTSTASGFSWPTDKTLPTSFEGGIPPLPGLEDGSGQAGSTGQGGILQLTGIIFDSHPVANIKFNGKSFSVGMNEWVGNCRVVAISKSQVVLAEPGGKQRRLYL